MDSRWHARLAIGALVLGCATAVLAQSGGPRRYPFIRNATSNFTVDLTSWAVKRNNVSTILAPVTTPDVFSSAPFRCQLFIHNASTTNQIVLNTTSVKLTLEVQESDWDAYNAAGILPQIPTPIQGRSGALLNYTSFGTSTKSMRQFTATSGQSLGNLVTGNRTLAPNQGLIIDVSTAFRARAEYWMGWLWRVGQPTGAAYYHPYVKMHHTCVGIVEVQDQNPAQKGFVLASGSMNYLADSYQQYPQHTGGMITRYQSNAGMISSGTAYGQTAFDYVAGVDPSVPAIYPWINDLGGGWGSVDNGWSDAANNSPNCTVGGAADSARYCFKTYGRYRSDADCGAATGTSFVIDNNVTRSSFKPARYFNVPIVINEGIPL